MLDPAYRLWPISDDRFALIPAGKVLPVLGFVTRNENAAWVIEYGGQILGITFESSEQAATALIELIKAKRRGPH